VAAQNFPKFPKILKAFQSATGILWIVVSGTSDCGRDILFAMVNPVLSLFTTFHQIYFHEQPDGCH
jgi:hypothetical protein